MKTKIEVPCPECGSTIRTSMDDVARQRTVRCARGHSVKLVDNGGGARKFNRALDDLERTIKKFGR